MLEIVSYYTSTKKGNVLMKRMIVSSELPKHIEVIFDVSLFDPDGRIAAANKIPDLPKGELMPAEKDALVNSQVLEDYHTFIETVEDLLVDYYDLHVFYKNTSPDNSFYYGMLANDGEGNVIADFDFTLRISTHPAKRSDTSQKHKKEKEAELLKLTKGKKLKPLRNSIVVNREEFTSYQEAYLKVDSIIEEAVKIMKRKLK